MPFRFNIILLFKISNDSAFNVTHLKNKHTEEFRRIVKSKDIPLELTYLLRKHSIQSDSNIRITFSKNCLFFEKYRLEHIFAIDIIKFGAVLSLVFDLISIFHAILASYFQSLK